ncbi:translocation/assembly module TamB domain-containing protein [Marinospirillum perlucidum]|uniref:translocation/assembly module TamB domain-containing protein n=1 Tax=Marinospirillum perlucidum TaxID=1982602 RepID=UPI000DF334EB|nr:translocation/assembly module TamB domain-containing protein [Marinospirillum perlucidum]
MIRRSWMYFRQRVQARLLRPLLWVHLLLRWLVYLVSASLSLATLLLLLTFFWLFLSEAGGSWLLRQLPGVELQGFSGQLLDEWQVEKVSWHNQDLLLEGEHLAVAWQPWCLLRLNICIQQLEASRFNIQLLKQTEVMEELEQLQTEGLDAFRMPGVELPRISLPWPLQVEHLHLGEFQINHTTHLQAVILQQGHWYREWMELPEIYLQSPWVPLDDHTALQAQGSLTLQGDWPLMLQAQGLAAGLELEADFAGSLQNLELQRLQARGLPLQASGKIQPLVAEVPMEIQLEVSPFHPQTSPLPDQLQPDWMRFWPDLALLDHLRLHFQGDLNQGWQLQGWGQLLIDETLVLADLDALITPQELQLKQLQLSHHREHQLQVEGRMTWEGLSQLATHPQRLEAQVHLSWRDFLNTQLPWRQVFTSLPAKPLEKEQLDLQLNFNAGQLYWGGQFAGQLKTDASALQISSQFAGHLPTQQLIALPFTADAEKSEAFAATLITWGEWLQTTRWGAEGQITGRGELAQKLFTGAAEYHFGWLGPEQHYRLAFPQISVQGDDEAMLEASLDLQPDTWQLSLAGYLPQLADLPLEATAPFEGDLQMAADLSLPALLGVDLLWPTNQMLLQRMQQGDYRLRGASDHLSWQDSYLQQAAVAVDFQGRMNDWQESSISAQGLIETITVAEVPLKNVHLDLSGTLAEQSWLLDAVAEEQPLELVWRGGWQESSDGQRRLNYHLEPFAMNQLAWWLPADLDWDETLEGNMMLAWGNQEQVFDLSLTAGDGQLRIRQLDEVTNEEEWLEFAYQQLEVSLGFHDQQLAISGLLDGPQIGQLALDMKTALVSPVGDSRPLDGRFEFKQVQVQLFQPFLNLDSLSGQLQGQGSLGGTLRQPLVQGELDLQKIAAADLQWPTSLTRLDAHLNLQADGLTLEGDYQAGRRGRGQFQGELNWQTDLLGELNIQGRQLDIRIEPWASLEIYPDLNLAWVDDELELTGQISIPRGQLEVQQLPAQAVRVSDDVQVLNRQPAADPLIKRISTDIEILLGSDRLQLSALGLEAAVQGRLGLGDNLNTRGELLLVEGRYQSWGQDLRLRRARLNFNGPLTQPYLDIEAVREIEEVLVGVRVTGRIDEPETEIFSEPAMSSEQALSWLLTGSPLDEEVDMNSLALSMGLAGISDYTQAVGEAFGVEEFELAAEGKGQEQSLVAAGYLNSDLSVRYGVGIYDDINRVAVRYELTRQLYIEVVSSLENSLDIFWEVDY